MPPSSPASIRRSSHRDAAEAGLLTPAQCAEFQERGYLIIRGYFAGKQFLDDINSEMVALGRAYAPDFELHTAAQRIRAFSRHARHGFYNGLRYLAALNRLGSSEALARTSCELGLKLPAVMRAYNIRMDMPEETDFLFHWHQDIAYTLGSRNSLTYWVPFGRVDAHAGSVEVIPGSHRQGVFPVRYTGEGKPTSDKIMSPKDLRLVHEPDQSGVVIEADHGDLVIFSTFILHRSVPNRGDHVRWTAQIRHADLADQEFMSAGYVWGDMTNIFHAPYLLDSR